MHKNHLEVVVVTVLLIGLILLSCSDPTAAVYETKNYDDRIEQFSSQYDSTDAKPIATPDQIDEFSRDEIEKMASSGEADQDIIPELNFWDKVSQDGSFAAFQKALKAAKTDEDRWKIADKYPEIAERSGMIDALSPRKDSSQAKAER